MYFFVVIVNDVVQSLWLGFMQGDQPSPFFWDSPSLKQSAPVSQRQCSGHRNGPV